MSNGGNIFVLDKYIEVVICSCEWVGRSWLVAIGQGFAGGDELLCTYS